MAAYDKDLAYIHDAGYGDFARSAAPTLLRMFRRAGIRSGLVVDLGCGSGIWVRELVRAGYAAFGVDISSAMIALARMKAPEARFAVSSLFAVDLPQSVAITSIGECLNYCFDPGNSKRAVSRLFRRVYDALTPGGLFIFDIAEPGETAVRTKRRDCWQGEDWAVLLQAEEDPRRGILTREITAFRKRNGLFGRSDETHRLRLYKASDLAAQLELIGFAVSLHSGYGRARLPASHAAIVARKPRQD